MDVRDRRGFGGSCGPTSPFYREGMKTRGSLRQKLILASPFCAFYQQKMHWIQKYETDRHQGEGKVGPPRNLIKNLTFRVSWKSMSCSSNSYHFPTRKNTTHPSLSIVSHSAFQKGCLPRAWTVPGLMLERGFLHQSEVNLDKDATDHSEPWESVFLCE